MGMRAYKVHIFGLTNTVHHFDFEVENIFFSHYGSELITEGSLKVQVTLDKHETFIDAIFEIEGFVKLTCDRSLDTFNEPIKTKKKLVFKYGETDEELSDEIILIHRETESLELGQYIFEFIALEVPMKKLHPRFRDEEDADDGTEGKIIYSSGSEHGTEDGSGIDPRWEILKKLK